MAVTRDVHRRHGPQCRPRSPARVPHKGIGLCPMATDPSVPGSTGVSVRSSPFRRRAGSADQGVLGVGQTRPGRCLSRALPFIGSYRYITTLYSAVPSQDHLRLWGPFADYTEPERFSPCERTRASPSCSMPPSRCPLGPDRPRRVGSNGSPERRPGHGDVPHRPPTAERPTACSSTGPFAASASRYSIPSSGRPTSTARTAWTTAWWGPS